MTHIMGAGDRGQRLAVCAATERLALLVGGQLRVSLFQDDCRRAKTIAVQVPRALQ
jgi:hypothetical protein